VQAYLRQVAAAGRVHRAAGCFDAYLHPQRHHSGTNYAIPRDGCTPGPEDIEALVGAFTSARRLPRLEYLEATAPAVEPALMQAGFELELRTSVMTCTPSTLRPAPSPARIERLSAISDPAVVRALVHAQQRAFGDEPDPDEHGLLRLPFAVAAWVGDEVVGGAMALEVIAETTELVGIAVLEPHRRQGIAGAVTAEVARMAFEAGATSVFLTPGDAGAQRVYARAGFADTGDVMLHLRRPTPAAPGR
jgi:GNAT superfamily N-acetyltransferase